MALVLQVSTLYCLSYRKACDYIILLERVCNLRLQLPLCIPIIIPE